VIHSKIALVLEKCMWQKIRQYFQEVISELKKTSWPTKAATKDMTVLVLVSVGLLAAFLGLIDFLLQKILTILI
jgi:preprotein translocase subunit SecE